MVRTVEAKVKFYRNSMDCKNDGFISLNGGNCIGTVKFARDEANGKRISVIYTQTRGMKWMNPLNGSYDPKREETPAQ
jgi:hypothetical protein